MAELTLVLSGSGALYPVHLGAAQALWETGVRWKRLVGTSGGALVAAFLATGAQPREGLALFKRVLPRDCLGTNWRFWKRHHWGLYTLSALDEKLAGHVPGTFARADHELHILTTDLIAREACVWSSAATPMAEVAPAARASASIPFLIAPWETYHNGRRVLLTDGGVVNNYPVDHLLGPALGIRLLSSGEGQPKQVRTAADFAVAVLGSMRRALEREHIEDAERFAKTISVEVSWDSMDLWSLDAEAVEFLYEVGYRAVVQEIRQGGKRW